MNKNLKSLLMYNIPLKATLSISLICSCVLAENDQQKNTVNLKETSVTEKLQSHYDETALKSYITPGSYNYLDDVKISRFRGSSVGDFLSGIPGVTTGNKRNSGAISVNIRGVQNENRVPVIIDNSLQSIPSWQGYAGSSTRTYLDPDLISEVEIEKGPTLKSDGVGATGGIVRMNTLGYKDIIPSNSDKDWGFRLRLGTMSNTVKEPAYGTRGGYRTKWISQCLTNNSGLCKPQTYKPDARYSSKNPFSNLGNSYNASIAFAKKWENVDIVLAYARKIQGNYFVGKHGMIPEIGEILHKETEVEVVPRMGSTPSKDEEIIAGSLKFKQKDRYTYYRSREEVLNTFQKNQSYLAKINTYNDNHALSFAYRGYRSKFGEMMPSAVSFRGDGALQGEGTEVKVDSYSVKYKYSPTNPYINLDISSYLTKSDSSNFTRLYEEYGYYNSSHAHFTASKQKGINISNTSKFKIADRPFSLNYGVYLSSEKINPPKDAQKRVEAKKYPKDAIAPLYIRNAKRLEKSAFISANYKPINWLSIDTAIRYINSKTTDYQPLVEFLGYDPKGNVISKKTYTPPVKNSGFSPIFMLTFQPYDGFQFYIKYAQALRSASLFQASRGFSTQRADAALASLKPERQKNLELGMNLLFDNLFKKDDIVGFKFAFFNNYTKDYLTRTYTKGSAVFQTANIKSALYRGFEVSTYLDIKNFYYQMGVTHYIKTKFCRKPEQMGINDTRECFSGGIEDSNIGNTLPPKTTFNATFGTRMFANKLDMGVRYSYYSSRIVSVLSFDSGVGDTKSAEWKPYSLFDLYASYKVKDNLTLSFGIDNLTNRYYLDANNMGLIPAPGRTFHLNLDYKF